MNLGKKLATWLGGPQDEASTNRPPAAQAPASNDAGAMQDVNAYARQLSEKEIEKGEHRTFVGGMWEEVGKLQFEFLKERGLKPHHKMLDVGCGALRGGLHFIRYLDAGNYHGLDINASLIDAAKHELSAAGLEEKRPHLLVNNQFEMHRFQQKFDYLLAVSVFTHLFANHLVRALVEARAVLADGGQFFATFFEAPSSAHLATITHQPGGVVSKYDSDPFHYSAEEIQFIARVSGLSAEIVGDWNHPRNQHMLRFYR